jgi:cytosine/adenosine deaminase-related metal-dependent hydrolase
MLTKKQICIGIKKSIADLKKCNTTVVGDISRNGESIPHLIHGGIRGVVFIEVLGRDLQYGLERFRIAKHKIRKWSPYEGKIRIGIELHSPYTCHPRLLEEVSHWCASRGIPLCIHVGESPAEGEYLRSGKGTLMRLNERVLPGGEHFIPRCSPIGYIASLGVLDASPALIHCNDIDDSDLDLISSSQSSIIHCPRSNKFLGCSKFRYDDFRRAGVPVALGTDSLASVETLDLRDEVAAVQSQQGLACLPHNLLSRFNSHGLTALKLG